jgi:hypothetical protein
MHGTGVDNTFRSPQLGRWNVGHRATSCRQKLTFKQSAPGPIGSLTWIKAGQANARSLLVIAAEEKDNALPDVHHACGFAVSLNVRHTGVFAQGQPKHDHNHGQGSAPAQTAAPPSGMMGCPMMGGMIGQQAGAMGSQPDMRQMMPMMHNMMAMMSAETGTMAPHVEGRIAALKTELKISEAQTPQWNRFADALRGTAKSMNDMHQSMMVMQPEKTAKSLPEQLAAREQMMTAHLASLKTLREALQPLYASFSDEQKKVADKIMIGPMGMM